MANKKMSTGIIIGAAAGIYLLGSLLCFSVLGSGIMRQGKREDKRLRQPANRWTLGVAITLLVVLLFAIVLGVYTYTSSMKSSQAPRYRTTTVKPGDLLATVTATGPLSAVTSLDLNFPTTGKVISIPIKVGEKVKSGQVLALQDTRTLTDQLHQAQASLMQAKANYAKITGGPLPGQVEVAQAQINSASSNLADAQHNAGATQSIAQQDNAAAQVAVDNAAQAVADAQKNYAAIVAQQSAPAAQVAVDNAAQAVADAQKNYEVTKNGYAIAVHNAQVALAGAQANLASVRQNVAASIESARLTYQQSGNNLYTQQINRDGICSGINTPRGSTYLVYQCTAAQSQVNAAITAQQQALASYRQAQTNGAQQIVSAQNAQAQAQSNLLAAQNSQSVVQAQNQLDQARQNLRTAQANLASTRAKDAGSVTTAQGQIDQARENLRTAQANLNSIAAKNASSLATSQGQIDQAAASLNSASANYDNVLGSVNPSDVDVAQAQVANAQAAVDLVQHNLDNAKLLSPVDGTVAAINGQVGQYGGAVGSGSTSTSGTVSSSGSSTTGGGFIVLTDLQALQITAQVNEADIANVLEGEKASFSVGAFPTRQFTGTVSSISPVGQTVSNVVNYNVQVTVDSTPIRLLPGMTANVTIVTAQKQAVLTIPTTALSFARAQLTRLRTGQGQNRAGQGSGSQGSLGASNLPADQSRAIILVDTNGKVTAQRIITGLNDGRNVEVVSGLQEGQQVIIGLQTTGTSGQQGQGGSLLPFGAPGGRSPRGG